MAMAREGVLGEIEILAGERRNDDPQGLGYHYQVSGCGLRLMPRAKAASVYPQFTAVMPARTISPMNAAV